MQFSTTTIISFAVAALAGSASARGCNLFGISGPSTEALEKVKEACEVLKGHYDRKSSKKTHCINSKDGKFKWDFEAEYFVKPRYQDRDRGYKYEYELLAEACVKTMTEYAKDCKGVGAGAGTTRGGEGSIQPAGPDPSALNLTIDPNGGKCKTDSKASSARFRH